MKIVLNTLWLLIGFVVFVAVNNEAIAVERVPSKMSVDCKFAINRSRHLEKLMSRAREPAQSIWLENYCRWVCEAKKDACGDLDRYLERIKFCPGRVPAKCK